MTIYQGLTTSFKVDILNGKQNLASDTLKIALYTAYASLDQDTTAYTSGNEISGTGYVAGGKTLSNVTINSGSNTVYVSFSNIAWNPAQFTTRGALIYNATKSNASIAVLDFGADKIQTGNNTFTVNLPPDTQSSALIRIT
jgi:hypothetical protein